MKSLTSLVFYTKAFLKIVILLVRLNSVLRRYVISEAGLKKLENRKPVKERFFNVFDFTLAAIVVSKKCVKVH